MIKGKGKAAARSFKWPAQKDVLWLERKSILCVFEAPVLVGKTGPAFKLTETRIELIEQRHGSYKLETNFRLSVCILSLALNRPVLLQLT